MREGYESRNNHANRSRRVHEAKAVAAYRMRQAGKSLSVICAELGIKDTSIHKILMKGERIDSIW